jgi:hypothetical protein
MSFSIIQKVSFMLNFSEGCLLFSLADLFVQGLTLPMRQRLHLLLQAHPAKRPLRALLQGLPLPQARVIFEPHPRREYEILIIHRMC